ncbi:hypothetical protein JB92DRAFT_3040474 [Gautieria morchelliformis]|nr:hypothetical protein JB92DRAFT_3040474 [Gautieria morchelliformis]
MCLARGILTQRLGPTLVTTTHDTSRLLPIYDWSYISPRPTTYTSVHYIMADSIQKLPYFANGDLTLARIHRHMLNQSPVIQNMINLQSEDVETLCGCPMIRLPESVDLSALLNALYDGLSLLDTEHFTIDAKCRMLRMATKYRMDGLRLGIIFLLKQDWPLVYSDYVQLKQKLGDHALKVINIAYECDVPELLRPAVFELCFRNPVDFSSVETEQLERLSAANIIRLFVGRQKAQPTCGGRNFALGQLGDYFSQGNSPYGVVERWSTVALEESLCSTCYTDLIGFVKKTEAYVLKNIRVDFNLPPAPTTRTLDDEQALDSNQA